MKAALSLELREDYASASLQLDVIYLIGTPAPASCETFGKVT